MTTTIAKTTVATTRKPETRAEKRTKDAAIAERKAHLDALKKKHGKLPAEQPYNFYHTMLHEIDPTHKVAAFYADELEVELVRYERVEHAWSTLGFCTKGQAAEFGGKPKKGEKPIALYNGRRGFFFYNYDQFEWEDGEPCYKQDVADANHKRWNERKAKGEPEPATKSVTIKGVTLDLTLDELAELLNKLS